MKKEDFKELTEEYAKTCESIIEKGGACRDIACNQCPFEYDNSTHNWGCMHYVIEEKDSWEKSPSLVINAKLFLELYNNQFRIIIKNKEVLK